MHFDTAYSDALGELAIKYPNDLNVLTFWAESVLTMTPWKYFRVDEFGKRVFLNDKVEKAFTVLKRYVQSIILLLIVLFFGP